MQVSEFPGSCTAKVATGFDNFNGTGIEGEAWGVLPAPDNVPDMKAWVIEQIVIYKEKGNAVLVFTTHSDQQVINEALLNLGVGHSPWMKKDRNNGTDLRVWYADLHRWNPDHIDRVDDPEEEE